MSVSATASGLSGTTESPLLPGSVVSSTYEIEALSASDSLGSTYQARDQSSRKPVSVFVLSQALSQDAALTESIKAAAEQVLGTQHAGLFKPLAVSEQAGQLVLVREALAGQNAAALIAERKAQGKSLSLRGVYNIIAHVCKAAAALGPGHVHGALRPSIVWVTQSGRVKLGDLELGAALAKLGRSELLPASEQAFLSPEVKQGKAPDVRSDVFGVGALLYGLLTARSPLDAFVIPSQLRKDASPALDAVMMRCLAADPAQRYASLQEVLQVILPLVAAAPEPVDQDFDVKLEIDIDIASSIAPPPLLQPSASSLLPVTIASDSPPANSQAPDTGPITDITDLTARLTSNDSPRWVAVKDGMDHGPFTARELIKMIVDGEVQEQHLLFNMSANERKPLAEYPDFQPFVQQYRIRRDEQEHAVALDRSKKDEKRSNVAKFAILAVSIGAIALIGGTYVLNRKAASARKRAEADLAALYESGQVQITGTAGILKLPTRGGSRGAKSGGGHSTGTGFGSYEDAMNQAMELGDATKGGGERQLTSGDVAGVMNRELNRMFGCVGEELRRGGKLGNVGIDIAILGSGKVAGASVHAGSAGFQRCIAAKVQSVHFPSFPAPRMGARYSFSVD
ncbi:MAG TPA: protein kinase [Polyangiales bacterium]|nr:protein kinase [Polyangiales bacterium]